MLERKELYNRALSLIGDREYKADTPTAKYCDIWFKPVMIHALSHGRWSFAMKKVNLNLNELTNSFTLPTDLIKLVTVDNYNYEKIGNELFVIEGEFCVDKTSKLEIRYVSNDLAFAATLPDTLPPLFQDAVVYLLASKLCIPLGVPELSDMFIMKYEAQISEALCLEMRQYASNDLSTSAKRYRKDRY